MDKGNSLAKPTIWQKIKTWWGGKSSKVKPKKSVVNDNDAQPQPIAKKEIDMKKLRKKIKRITAMAIASSRKRVKELTELRERERETKILYGTKKSSLWYLP